jgi:hypothetical protein
VGERSGDRLSRRARQGASPRSEARRRGARSLRRHAPTDRRGESRGVGARVRRSRHPP